MKITAGLKVDQSKLPIIGAGMPVIGVNNVIMEFHRPLFSAGTNSACRACQTVTNAASIERRKNGSNRNQGFGAKMNSMLDK